VVTRPDPPASSNDDDWIGAKERALRAWFTEGADPILAEIDGLDIGWGGVQRWATAQLPPPGGDAPCLDVACGYATFLAQLGWRFPSAWLVGLNIDFAGPHATARPLLEQAGVSAALVRADARHLPFAGDAFGLVSCFLGLQDIEIGFGLEGVRAALEEAARVLRPGGVMALWDEWPYARFDDLLAGLPLVVGRRAKRRLDVRWGRQVAERAIVLYAEGWAAQARLSDPDARAQAVAQAHHRMTEEMESQLAAQGYYVPFGPIRMVVAQKVNGE
jgi:SAM-dependent methyltransferase